MENQNKELEQMREQLAILNKKLANQQIVSDQLLRQSMKNKMSWIKKFVWGETFAMPFIILVYLMFVLWFNLSWGPFILMSVMLIVSVVSDHRINMVSDDDFLSGDLRQTALRLTRMKKLRLRYELWAIPTIVVWVAWLAYDIYSHTPVEGMMHDAFVGGLVGCLIGAVIGCVAGLYVVNKMQRTNDEIIQQINELED